MNLLVIRHAIAEDKENFAATGRSDDQRPLTDAGRTKMRRGTQGLRTLIGKVAMLASSPLVRARETAEIRSEEHTSELQSRRDLVCRLLLEKKKSSPGSFG